MITSYWILIIIIIIIQIGVLSSSDLPQINFYNFSAVKLKLGWVRIYLFLVLIGRGVFEKHWWIINQTSPRALAQVLFDWNSTSVYRDLISNADFPSSMSCDCALADKSWKNKMNKSASVRHQKDSKWGKLKWFQCVDALCNHLETTWDTIIKDPFCYHPRSESEFSL